MKRTGEDLRHISTSGSRAGVHPEAFPNIHGTCLSFGIDMTVREPIPVVPRAHYQCGGVRTNLHGETDIQRLFRPWGVRGNRASTARIASPRTP